MTILGTLEYLLQLGNTNLINSLLLLLTKPFKNQTIQDNDSHKNLSNRLVNNINNKLNSKTVKQIKISHFFRLDPNTNNKLTLQAVKTSQNNPCLDSIQTKTILISKINQRSIKSVSLDTNKNNKLSPTLPIRSNQVSLTPMNKHQ